MTGTELARIFIGSTLLALGFVSTAGATVRFHQGSTMLLTFGLWTAMYGARMLASQPPVRAALGGEPQVWEFVHALITYTINIPITFFIGSLIGPGWRNTVKWVAAASIAFAIVATALALATGNPEAAMRANTWLVLAGLVVGLVSAAHVVGVRRTRTLLTDPVVLFGIAVLGLLVINEIAGIASRAA
jgi:hypothetical protein